MKYNLIKQEKGFTLIELVVSMVIGTMVLGLVCNTFIFQQKTYDVQEQVTEMTQMARATMDYMTREIRMAGYDPVPRIVPRLIGIPYSTTQLQILADLNNDDVISGTADNENITYLYNNDLKRIMRTANGTSQILADQVENFDFIYLQADGVTPATTAAEIRQVQIALTFRTAKPDPDYPDNGGYRTYTLTSTITPKNLSL